MSKFRAKNFDPGFYWHLTALKSTLNVTKDQDVATVLGLSKSAFSERKRRNAFPEKDLRDLAHRHPELSFDVDYVLAGGLSADDAKFLYCYRNSPLRVKEAVRLLVAEFAQPQYAIPYPQPSLANAGGAA